MPIVAWFFAKFGIKGILYVAGAVAITVALASEYHHIKTLGEEAERQRIEKANEEAERKADDGKSAVDKCYGNGGTWDRSRGVCNPGSG
jgi:sugar phosphate permease